MILCSAPDTQMVTKRGIIDAEYVEVGDSLFDGSDWRDVQAKIVNEPSPMMRVTLSNGMELCCVPHHPFLTEDGFVEAQYLTLGREVKVQTKESRTSFENLRIPVPPQDVILRNQSRMNNLTGCDLEIDERVAKLLGWITGDGCVSDTHDRYTVYLQFNSDEYCLALEFKETLESLGLQVPDIQDMFGIERKGPNYTKHTLYIVTGKQIGRAHV